MLNSDGNSKPFWILVNPMNLKELAQSLGLSPTTVSRALGGYPEVSEATRRRVEIAAERANYRPDVRARSLATGRAMAIGHVLSLSTRNEVVNPIFAEFIAGASETYSRNGYDLNLSIARVEDETEIYRDMKAKRSVDGIIVHTPRRDDPRITLLQDVGLPFVVHGRALGVNTNYSWIDINNRQAFEHATNFLLDLGHRRIALVNGLESLGFAEERRSGYEAALRERDIAPDPAIIGSSELTEGYGYRSAMSMLGSGNRPTAFLVSSVVVAIGVRRAIEERGWKLGRDISVVTHDDELSFFAADTGIPEFTATRSSVRLAGRLAADMLLDIIREPDAAPRTRLLKAELTVGQSTGPAPAAG